MDNSSAQVLIAGAGPTGLALGIALQRQGIRCTLVDRLAQPRVHSRAVGLQARSAEILAALGVLPALQQGCLLQRSACVYGDHGLLFEFDLHEPGSPYVGVLSCSQHHLEAVLSEHYLSLGGQLLRGVELLDFVQDGQSVQSRLRQGNTISRLQSAVLVGADGVDSTVRQTLGIGLDGDAAAEQFMLLDCDWQDALSRHSSHAFLLADGPVFAQPLPQGWRFMLSLGSEPDASSAAEQGEDALAMIQQRLAPVLASEAGDLLQLSAPRWQSRFSVQRRLAHHYRRNRVFLAGDAAHVQSPLGGQSMNTGLADIFNLSWKLALYLRGKGSGALLDSYEQERRPVAEAMLHSVDLLSRAALIDNKWLRRSRDSLLKLAGQRPALTRRLRRRLNQLDVHYRASPLVASGPETTLGHRNHGPLPGDRLADVVLASLRTGRLHHLHDLLRKPVHHVLLQLGANPEHAELLSLYALIHRLADDYPDDIHLTVICENRSDVTQTLLKEGTVRVWHDEKGDFAALFGEASRLWLMRPDGHLGYRAPLTDGDHFLAWLEQLLGAAG